MPAHPSTKPVPRPRMGAGRGDGFGLVRDRPGTVWDRLRRMGRVQWQQPKHPEARYCLTFRTEILLVS